MYCSKLIENATLCSVSERDVYDLYDKQMHMSTCVVRFICGGLTANAKGIWQF